MAAARSCGPSSPSLPHTHLCRWLWLAAQPGQQAVITFSTYTPTDDAFDDLSSYSSFGPTPDGRFKPDIIAPGHTISAMTSGTLSGSPNGCGTTEMQVCGCVRKSVPPPSGQCRCVGGWVKQSVPLKGDASIYVWGGNLCPFREMQVCVCVCVSAAIRA